MQGEHHQLVEPQGHPHGNKYEQNKFVQVMSSILRPLNFIGGVGTIAAGVIVIMFQGITFRTLLNLYFTSLLGVLLMAGEWNLNVINTNCKFLVTLLGRGFFDIFVGGWVYSQSYLFTPNPDSFFDELATLGTFIVYVVRNPFFFLFFPSHNSISSLIFSLIPLLLGSLGYWRLLPLLALRWKEQIHLRHPEIGLMIPNYFRCGIII